MFNGLFYVLLGAFGIGLGVLQRRAGDRWPLPQRRWASKLAGWNAAPTSDIPELERQIRAYFRSLTAVTAAATGVALVALGAVLLALTAGGHAPPVLWDTGPLYLALLVGTGLGYPLAARLPRRPPAAGPRYADLHRRHLADYRSPGLRWLAPVAIAVQAVAAAVLVLMGGGWIALLMPVLGGVAYGVGEVQMWSAARAPRMVVTPDPVTARRCDDLVRADLIARLQGLELLTVGFAGAIGIIVAGGLVKQWGLAAQVVDLACFLSIAYCVFFAIGLYGLEERLGGRVTGWWGRPMPR